MSGISRDWWEEWRSELISTLASPYQPEQHRPAPTSTGRGPLPCSGKIELFFSGRREDETKAKALCRGCRHSAPCLSTAMEKGLAGVWGGTTEAERRLAGKDGGGV